MIRRCLWCRKRIGEPSYYFDSTWKREGALLAHEWQKINAHPITDGICPACVKEARKEKKHGKA